MQRIKLAQLECDLLDIDKEMKRCEGIINSTKIKNNNFKKETKKKLINLIKQKNEISNDITESFLLDMEIE